MHDILGSYLHSIVIEQGGKRKLSLSRPNVIHLFQEAYCMAVITDMLAPKIVLITISNYKTKVSP